MMNIQTLYMWLAVAGGGAIGSVMRYGVSLLIQARAASTFPYATMLVNVLGSLIMGFLFIVLLERFSDNLNLRLLLTVGVLGSFTTFSTFSLDAFMMIERGEWSGALIYIAGSVFLSLAALTGGVYLGRFLLGLFLSGK